MTFLYYCLNMRVLLPEYTKVRSSTITSNVVAIYFCKPVCVCRFVSVRMFTKSIRGSSCVRKKCDFYLVSQVIIDNKCSVSVCHKVCKSILANVSTNLFHVSSPDVVNVKIVLSYQQLNSTNNASKFVPSTSAVTFLPAPTLFTVNHATSLHVRNVLMSVNNICHVRKVSRYIPLSVNTSRILVSVSHNLRHAQSRKCLEFKSKVSLTSNFKQVFLSQLYTIIAVILFITFSFTESAKAISICNIFGIIALSLLLYVRFYTKNGEGVNISLV